MALGHAGVGFLAGGFVGVDVFFVLSGFLITGLLLSGATTPRRDALLDFYVRRARRILPAAALTLIVTDIVSYYLLNFVRAKEIVQDSISASLFTANIHFANQGVDYFARAQPPSPLQHYWSLAVEEQFYLIWPAALSFILFGVLLHRRFRRRQPILTERAIRRLLLTVVAATLASLAWSVYDTSAHATSAYFSTFARTWELGLGAAIAIGAPRLRNLSLSARWALGWFGLASILAAGVVFTDTTPFPGSAALLPTIGAACIICAGSGQVRGRHGVDGLLALSPLRYIGDRSYSFYLWHWPVLVIAAEYHGHALSLRTKLSLLVGAFLLAIVTYKCVENPIRRANRARTTQLLALWPASILAVVAVAGYILHTVNAREALASDNAAPVFAASSATLGPSTPSGSAGASSGPAGGNGAIPQVNAAVAAARRGAPIPSSLAPPVADLLSDHYQVPPGCAASTGMTSSAICRLGDPGGSTVIAVIGDSHAQMWMPALLSVARQAGWQIRLVSKSSCTPYDWSNERPGSECRRWYRWAIQQVIALRPAVTLVGGYYSTPTIDSAFASASANGLNGLANSLKVPTTTVVILGDVPSQAREPVDCLLARHATLETCTTILTAGQSGLNEQIAATARAQGEGFLDPTGWFCAEAQCPVVVGHTIAYTDAGHISRTYAVELGEVFRAALGRALRAVKSPVSSRAAVPRTTLGRRSSR